jgi:hypothetical protein
MAVHPPGNMIEMQWKAAFYVDQRSDAGQKEALTRILSGQAGGHPAVLASHVGEFLGAKSVPINYLA